MPSSPPQQHPGPPASSSAGREFIAAVAAAIGERSFEAVVLSKPRGAGRSAPTVRVRLIAWRGAEALSFVHAYPTRDETHNVALPQALETLTSFLDVDRSPSFAHATLHAGGGALQLRVSRKGQETLSRLERTPVRAAPRRRADGAAPAGVVAAADDLPPPADGGLASHDRMRRRRLPLDLPFLVELGITDANHRPIPALARKWRQVERFLEILDHALDELAGRNEALTPSLRVVDFGSGKGYLTFAVHEHLRRRFGQAPRVTGVERHAELAAFTESVARRCGCAGLHFETGDIAGFATEPIDVMIALHACDTATDHALAKGLAGGAAIMVAAPCCHRELRPQLAMPGPLAGLLRHGIHIGQEAEMLTDSLRSLLLETSGYAARVFEFVSLEHTQKNKMILATRRGNSDADGRARAEIDELKRFYGIREQCLETLLARRARS